VNEASLEHFVESNQEDVTEFFIKDEEENPTESEPLDETEEPSRPPIEHKPLTPCLRYAFLQLSLLRSLMTNSLRKRLIG
jgi:hypothetical protein